MNSVLLTALIGVATTFASGFISYIFTRKKYNSEVDHNVIQNMQEALEFWTNVSEGNKKILEDMSGMNRKILEENSTIKNENRQLKNDLSELKTEWIAVLSKICLNMTCEERISGSDVMSEMKFNIKEKTKNCNIKKIKNVKNDGNEDKKERA